MAARRTRIKVGGKASYVVRDALGRFKDIVNIGRSIHADARKKAKHKVKKRGQGNKGDYAKKKKRK